MKKVSARPSVRKGNAMNVWKLAGAKNLVRSNAPLPAPAEGMLRVRVTKVLIGNLDAAIYDGAVRVQYPLVPGRFAVGVVGESESSRFPKGTLVLLHSYRPILPKGTEKADLILSDYEICGKTCDGFLSDFVLASPDNMTALPSSVTDEQGLLLHHVAAGKAIADRLAAQKGQHVVVVGANLMGILLCQILIYQQTAPILVDSDPDRLKFARSCGVYYTVAADKTMVDDVCSLTGGRLASGAVYIASATKNDPRIPFRLCADGGKVILCGSGIDDLTLDLKDALIKHLTIHCISHGAGYLPTAINLMANGAIDPSPFRANTVKAGRAGMLLAKFAEKHAEEIGCINVIDLL